MAMKPFVAAVALLVTATVALPAGARAQGEHAHHPAPAAKAKAEGEHHMMSSGWKELDTFHEVMAATWHPVTKSNDLSVIRAKAGALSAAAATWARSAVPSACDTKANRDAIAAVAAQSKAVAALVEGKAGDAELKKALHDVHERFEVVEHGCHPGAKH